jgi:hypothetical protein
MASGGRAARRREQRAQQKFLEGPVPNVQRPMLKIIDKPFPGHDPERHTQVLHRDQRLYHGSSRDIQGQILPNKIHKQGRANFDSDPNDHPDRLRLDTWLRHNKAYGTASEPYAWEVFAHGTADRPGGGRGRVYDIGAVRDQRRGLQPGAYSNEVTNDAFKIHHQLDVKPGHQGTLPIDWRPYAAHPHNRQGPGSDARMNHPSPAHQEWDDLRAKATEIQQRKAEQNPPPVTQYQPHEQLSLQFG